MDFLKKLPIGQYVPGDSGWIRRIDPRIKFLWVMMFLITPVLAGSLWRVGLVLLLLVITCLSLLPLRIWWRSVSYLAIFSILIGLITTFLPTSEPSIAISFRSPLELSNAITTSIPWEIFRIGPLQLGDLTIGPLLVDRRSFELGIKTSTLVFTVIHSVNLMLLTTSPEDLTWTLSWFLRPLGFFRLPIERMSFQLLLALRFLPLVQEEMQNLLRSLSTRAIRFRELGFKASIGVVLSLGEKMLANILLRAEQGAEALLMRSGGSILKTTVFKPEEIISSKNVLLNISCVLSLVFMVVLRQKFGEI